ncbi:NAD(P)H-dependent oxidoreductase [Defluviimonas sp. WL0050]|uniref:NAD(P)H-dependent oxidoreductase n=1 Tax=Albidovulum litorale TaxID=2984134 RepID=A0ABT2ZLT7_9RHOB|nr:NAD(P)H-dependent oxidoreductase [Defluviimonas sp. WL0050]MCV2872090.1 NAD(P)H-dependent oxidoreductase [Defluviimonas sp. WL0050]
MSHPRLLGIAGALRTGSTNRLLVREAARLFGPADFTEADLHLPLYDGDVEERGMPEAVTRLADQIAASDAIVISTPEYNSGISGVLKNALDWVSRTGKPWQDKPVAILSAAAGRSGGARAQFALRLALTPFRPRLLSGPEVMISESYAAFDDNGRLIDANSVELLGSLMNELRAESAPLAAAA